jgi:MFS transporter, ACS family, allantoate permease
LEANVEPSLQTAKYTMFAFLIFTAILLATMGLIHWSWNKKRDRQDALDAQSMSSLGVATTFRILTSISLADGVVHQQVENEEFADLTDWQIRSFRYPL